MRTKRWPFQESSIDSPISLTVIVGAFALDKALNIESYRDQMGWNPAKAWDTSGRLSDVGLL